MKGRQDKKKWDTYVGQVNLLRHAGPTGCIGRTGKISQTGQTRRHVNLAVGFSKRLHLNSIEGEDNFFVAGFELSGREHGATWREQSFYEFWGSFRGGEIQYLRGHICTYAMLLGCE